MQPKRIITSPKERSVRRRICLELLVTIDLPQQVPYGAAISSKISSRRLSAVAGRKKANKQAQYVAH